MNDDRIKKRAEISATVRLRSPSDPEFKQSYLGNVSEVGLFVRSEEPVKKSTLLKIEIDVDGEEEPIAAVGRVVWRRVPIQANENAPAGMGIKFVKVTGDGKERIAKLVEQAAGSEPSSFEVGMALRSSVPPKPEGSEPEATPEEPEEGAPEDEAADVAEEKPTASGVEEEPEEEPEEESEEESEEEPDGEEPEEEPEGEEPEDKAEKESEEEPEGEEPEDQSEEDDSEEEDADSSSEPSDEDEDSEDGEDDASVRAAGKGKRRGKKSKKERREAARARRRRKRKGKDHVELGAEVSEAQLAKKAEPAKAQPAKAQPAKGKAKAQKAKPRAAAREDIVERHEKKKKDAIEPDKPLLGVGTWPLVVGLVLALAAAVYVFVIR